MRSDAADTLIGTVALDDRGSASIDDGGRWRLLLWPGASDSVAPSPAADARRELDQRGVKDGDTIQIRAVREEGGSGPTALVVAFEGIVS